MAPMPVEVAPGYKFAVMALPGSRGSNPPDLLALPNGYFVSRGLPVDALSTWRESIGTLHRDELARCGFYLWALAHSQQPEVLDSENEVLARRVHYLFLALLLAVPYFSAGRLTRLTGANADGTARVRSLTTFARTYATLGAPEPNVSPANLKLAETLATALVRHDQTGKDTRFDRSLRAFRVACEAAYLDERHHEFVRAAEGFVNPRHGTEFTARLSQVCAGRCRQHLRQIYQIRSGIEHLHGIYERMPKYATKRQQFRIALRRCVQAEALARYLLTVYLLHPPLWPHFRTRTSIEAFWALQRPARAHLWPTKLHLPSILQHFDSTAVAQHEDRYLESGRS
jgi:hypothetical protein